MVKKKLIITAILIITLSLFLIGCQTEEPPQPPPEPLACETNDDCSLEEICDAQTKKCEIAGLNLLE